MLLAMSLPALATQWVTESYNPNQSPPGGMLRFELLTDAADKRYIKVVAAAYCPRDFRYA